ncbi:ribonuclease inhibitor [Dyadobacter aurulentus]|uniref:ribonuclease inhibitor n=1 Tax=Dyadobacter sp. UC 10 TaxID=2605428 RepID=UPI0011F2BA1D|nr:ribonuclease inhibitor [Dyadobacter sp. UC 10]KAA0992696.1 ribonuclease inhibitor [Dyadobacter sp. UC 10]
MRSQVPEEIIIDGNAIHDIGSFYDEINRVFMAGENWTIGNSLDALNDLFYGGYGVLKNTEYASVLWYSIEKSRSVLGYETTKAYYLEKLKPGSPFNKNVFTEKLSDLESGTGETYFDIIISIIAAHPNISLKTSNASAHEMPARSPD